jgi:hypothetical protein
MEHHAGSPRSTREDAMRTSSIVITSILAATACTVVANEPTADVRRTAAPPGDVLTLGTRDGSVIVTTATGGILSSPGEHQVAAPDGARLYAAVPEGSSTTLEVRASSTGALLSETLLDGRLDVRVASLTGRAVAMMRPLPDGVDATIAFPRARTAIVVADPAGERPPRRYALEGNFEPEAFSIDDTRLFLIQYLPAEAPSAYRVTFLDLDSGRVHPVFGRFDTPPERMPGVRLAQVFDVAAEQLYTLYTNAPAEHFHDHWQDAAYGEREVSFVHVLNLRQGWAYCAGLPRALWGQPARAQALAPSADGRSLFVVDAIRGVVTELNTRTMTTTRTRSVDLGGAERGRTSSVAGPDGSTLYVGVGHLVVAIDVRTLDVVARWNVSGGVAALALSPGGDRLYAAVRDGVAIVETATGRTVGGFSSGPVGSILHVTAAA